MRPAGENPDGGARRQPQCGGRGRSHGLRREGKLAELTRLRNGSTRMRLLPLAILPLLAGCASYPPPPVAPYHGVGTEPFWNLIIDDKNVTFIRPEQQPLVQPKPQVIVG